MSRTMRVEMTVLEANAVLRVLAAGNASTGHGAVSPADQAAATWVAKRIVSLLDGKAEETADMLELADKLRKVKPTRGSKQKDVLRALQQHQYWFKGGAGWLWDTDSGTERVMDALVRRGLATVENRKVPGTDRTIKYYRPAVQA